MRVEIAKEATAFSLWLSRYRRNSDLTQQDLALLVGYSLETIKKIEEGKRRPSRQIAERLAVCLEIAADERPLFVKFARADLSVEVLAQRPNAPWRALGRHPNNLPAQLTAFVGREQVVSHVASLLKRPGVRLLTLTGPPGIGKSRIALQVAGQLLDEFPDGVFFVPLAPILEAKLVTTTVSQTLAVPQRDSAPLLDELKNFLRDKRMLLLLDNFEHVIEAAPVATELLLAAPELKVVATSRVPLHLYGEYGFQVSPMTLPERKPLPPVEQLTDYEAVRLFTERALAARSDFEITSRNATTVVDICTGLEGVPLALELAAARVKLFPLENILSQLKDRMELLVGGSSDLPARQQTLRGAVAWSYDLLDAHERALFRRLAVFMGGCALEAVEAVCNEGDTLATSARPLISIMSSLADVSLLQQAADEGGVIRYSMLETIRQYAAEELGKAGEAENAHERHAHHFMQLAEWAEPELRGSQQIIWLRALEREHDNIRAALKWTLEHGQTETAARMAVALARFWYVYGHAAEGLQWLEAILAEGQKQPLQPPLNAPLQADALCAAGLLARHQGSYERAGLHYKESLELYREVGDVRGVARVLNNLASVVRYGGDDMGATTLLRESLALSQEVGNKEGMAASLNLLGLIARHSGDPARAAGLCGQSLALYRQLGDTVGIADALSNLGTTAHVMGDYAQAATYYAESLAIFREVGNKPGIAVALTNLGLSALHAHNYPGAETLYSESLALRREMGNNASTAYALNDLGTVEYKQGRHTLAERHYSESLALFVDANDRRGMAECLERLACMSATQRQSAWAAQLLGAAEALRESGGTQVEPEDRADYDECISLVREQLGEDMLPAWREGRGLPVEQIISSILGKHDAGR